MGSALLGRAHRDAALEVHQARRVTLTPRREQPVQFDGEDGGRTKKLSVEVVPQAVLVLLPADAPALNPGSEAAPVIISERVTRRWLLVPFLILLAAALFALRPRR